jgi:hypothetical protein
LLDHKLGLLFYLIREFNKYRKGKPEWTEVHPSFLGGNSK